MHIDGEQTRRTAWVAVGLGACLLAVSCSHKSDGETTAATRQSVTQLLSITLSAPDHVAPTAPVLECADTLSLAARASVTGTVVALGSASPSFSAAHAVNVTGDVWSRSLATVASAVQIGTVAVLHAGQLQTSAGDSIGGTDATTHGIDPTSKAHRGPSPYPSGTASDDVARQGRDDRRSRARTLRPTVSTAAEGEHLQLSAGTYYLTGLQLARASTVTLDPADGAVIVYVTTSLQLDAAVASPAGPLASFFVGYFGTNGVNLGISGAPFYGDIVAPSASLTIHAASSPHSGFFAAANMTLTASAAVQYAPPTALVTASLPNLVCVEPAGSGQYIALFGYNNATDAIGHVPVGPQNEDLPRTRGAGPASRTTCQSTRRGRLRRDSTAAR